MVGQTVTANAQSVLKEMLRFYQELYTSSQIELDPSYLLGLEHTTVEHQDKLFMERVLDTDEIISAIKQMKPNKAPGTDGLPIEFFRVFSSKIRVLLCNVYQEAIANGKI